MWLEGPIPEELGRFPGYLMVRLGQRSSRRFAELLAPLDIHPKHFGVLNIVDHRPGVTQNELRDSTGIDPSSMVGLIDELEERGLAERRPHPSDRRARAIYLTDGGQKTLGQARKIAMELQHDFFGVLSEEEARTLHELLRKVALSHAAAVGPEGELRAAEPDSERRPAEPESARAATGASPDG